MSDEHTGKLVQRNWVPVIGAAVTTLAGTLAVVWTRGNAQLVGALAIWMGAFALPLFIDRNAYPRRRPVSLRLTSGTLVIGERLSLLLDDVVRVKVRPRRMHRIVALETRAGAVTTLELDPPTATALMNVMGPRASRFVLVVPDWRRFFAWMVFFYALAALAIQNLRFVLFATPAVCLVSLFMAWVSGLARGQLTVGADGFTTRWFALERFVSFRSVSSVERTARDVVVTLTSGKRLRLRTVEAPNDEDERGAETHAMFSSLHDAFERFARTGGAHVPTVVARGRRTPREWLAGLNAVLGGSGYRIAASSRDRLVELMCDPTTASDVRVGAAAATLFRVDDEALRARVRVAAESCADTTLRRALEEIAEAREEPEFEAALARFAAKR